MSYHPFKENIWNDGGKQAVTLAGLNIVDSLASYGASKAWEKQLNKKMGEEVEFNDVIDDSNALRSSAFRAAQMYDPNATTILSTLGATLYNNYNQPSNYNFTPISHFGQNMDLVNQLFKNKKSQVNEEPVKSEGETQPPVVTHSGSEEITDPTGRTTSQSSLTGVLGQKFGGKLISRK